MRFLIVDDSEASLKHVRQILTEMGHTVAGEGHDGEEAVAMYDALRPDAVIMDVIMPKLNGIEALRAIRSVDPCASVVMTCSLRSCETAFESQRCGAMYFLSKPFQDTALRNVIRKLNNHRIAQTGASELKPMQQWAASQPASGQWMAKDSPVVPPPLKPTDPIVP
jgi:two-component system chemotaxis response regulator CheY